MSFHAARRAPLALPFFAFLFLLLRAPAGAAPRTVASPDGRILFSLELDEEGRTMLVVEMNTGQMVEDVSAVVRRCRVESLTKPAWYFTPEEILEGIEALVKRD